MPVDSFTAHVFADRDGVHAVASLEDHNAALLLVQSVDLAAAQLELTAWLSDACWLPDGNWEPDGPRGYSRRFTPGPNAARIFTWDAG